MTYFQRRMLDVHAQMFTPKVKTLQHVARLAGGDFSRNKKKKKECARQPVRPSYRSEISCSGEDWCVIGRVATFLQNFEDLGLIRMQIIRTIRLSTVMGLFMIDCHRCFSAATIDRLKKRPRSSWEFKRRSSITGSLADWGSSKQVIW